MLKTSTLFIFIIISLSSAFAQKRIIKKEMDITKETFYIKNVAANKYLDLKGRGADAQTQNGSRVSLWDLDEGNDRKYKFVSAGGDYYYIVPQHCDSRLDVHGCYDGKWFCKIYKKDNGAPIQIWSFNGKSGPDCGKWKLVQKKNGQFQLINKYAKKNLDAAGDHPYKNGNKVHLWKGHNGDDQLWELIEVKTGQRYEK